MKYKFGFNRDNKKSDWVGIHFQGLTKEQLEHLHKAEMELLKAGISFDTGFDFCSQTRDWEFDWALKGASVKIKRDPTMHADAVQMVKEDLEKHGASVQTL
jgi:hypothetical protein